MKNKKHLFAIILFALTVATCGGFVACDNGTKESPNVEDLGVSSLKVAEESLRFQKISGKDEYRVMGMGTVSTLDIVIPETYRDLPVTEIGAYAFENECYIETVQMSNNVTVIGDSAFYGCSALTDVKIPDDLTSIGNSAFSGCTSLLNVVIPNSVTSVGDSAFSGCVSLNGVTIGDGVVSIGKYAFNSCFSLMSVEIPDGVTSIGNGAFCSCEKLTSIKIPDGVTYIAFDSFMYCSSLINIVIPNRVTIIYDKAFYGCTSLASVYYKGTVEEWERVLIAGVDDNLTSATRYYYTEEMPTEAGNWWRYNDNGEIVTTII